MSAGYAWGSKFDAGWRIIGGDDQSRLHRRTRDGQEGQDPQEAEERQTEGRQEGKLGNSSQAAYLGAGRAETPGCAQG